MSLFVALILTCTRIESGANALDAILTQLSFLRFGGDIRSVFRRETPL